MRPDGCAHPSRYAVFVSLSMVRSDHFDRARTGATKSEPFARRIAQHSASTAAAGPRLGLAQAVRHSAQMTPIRSDRRLAVTTVLFLPLGSKWKCCGSVLCKSDHPWGRLQH